MGAEDLTDGTRITNRDIYDLLVSTRDEVRDTSSAVRSNEEKHEKAHGVFDTRLANHGERIRDVEAWQNRHSDLPGDVVALAATVHLIETAQNRSAWVVGLVAALVPTVIGGLVIWAIVPR